MAVLTICHCEDRSLTRLDAKFWKKMGVLPLLDRLDETGKILPDEPSGKLEEEERDLMVHLELEIVCRFFFPKKNHENNWTLYNYPPENWHIYTYLLTKGPFSKEGFQQPFLRGYVSLLGCSWSWEHFFWFVGSLIDIPIHFHYVSATHTAMEKSTSPADARTFHTA